jgi:hypothetical protein
MWLLGLGVPSVCNLWERALDRTHARHRTHAPSPPPPPPSSTEEPAMRTGGRRPLVLCLCWLGPPCSALLAPPPSTPLPAAAVAGRGGRAPFLYSSREPAEVELSERAKQIAQDASERVAARVNYNVRRSMAHLLGVCMHMLAAAQSL